MISLLIASSYILLKSETFCIEWNVAVLNTPLPAIISNSYCNTLLDLQSTPSSLIRLPSCVSAYMYSQLHMHVVCT